MTNFNVGDTVAVCQDGKISRAVPGYIKSKVYKHGLEILFVSLDSIDSKFTVAIFIFDGERYSAVTNDGYHSIYSLEEIEKVEYKCKIKEITPL